MTRGTRIGLLTWALVFGSAGVASAQTLVADQQAVFLAPADGSPINSPRLFAAETSTGAAPETPVWGIVKADIDFVFLQPIFPSRAVRLQVPAPGGAVLGDTSNLSNDFTFNPGFEVGYQFKNTGFGIQATGRLLHLTGSIERTIHNADASVLAQATARSTVDIGVVNPIEGFVSVPLSEWCECQHEYLRDTMFVFSIGGRYAHFQQSYTSTVITGASSQGTLIAEQNFDGFGLSGSASGIYPIKERWALYSSLRGSFLIGDNTRESSITIVSPAANSAVKARESITELIPTGELEAGVMYGIPLNRPGPSPNAAPLLWVKSGLVGQIWGDLGLLRINEAGGHQFSDSAMWLVGFSVQIGLDY